MTIQVGVYASILKIIQSHNFFQNEQNNVYALLLLQMFPSKYFNICPTFYWNHRLLTSLLTKYLRQMAKT